MPCCPKPDSEGCSSHSPFRQAALIAMKHQSGAADDARQSERGGDQVTVATLNARGVPLTGSRLAGRFAAIADSFEPPEIDVVCFQEVFTYWHLGLLARRMPSFP